MANQIFKGFKQATLTEYNAATDKKGYIWFVRELSGDTETAITLSSAIYLGARKYADMNADGKEANIINSLGSMVDENGNWLGFTPTIDHEILGDATDTTNALSLLETAILAAKSRMDSAETRITAAENAITALTTEVDTKASQTDLNTLSGKVAANETAIGTKASQEDLVALADRVTTAETRLDTLEENVEELGRVTATALTDLNGRVEVLESDITKKAEASDVTALGERVTNAENAITALTTEVNSKANAADVYTKTEVYNKNEVYNKDEVDGKIAGAFKFMGTALTISTDAKSIEVASGETTVWITAAETNRGHVYQIGDKEYASNGEMWIELGFAIDLSAYAKTADVNTAITTAVGAEESARTAADAALETAISNVATYAEGIDSALSQEVQIRQILSGRVDANEAAIANLQTTVSGKADATELSALEIRVTAAEGDIDNLDTRATFTAETFADIVVSAMTLGQIVYVAQDETGVASARTKGAYIKITDGLKKLDISSGQGDTPLDRIEKLENTVGSTPITGTVTENIVKINTTLTIEGNDVDVEE